MGFIAACLLLALLIKLAWDFFTKPVERATMLTGYAKKPIGSTFLVIWMAFFLMFFLGVFIRPLGDIQLTDDGWQVWEVGTLGFFGMWLVTWFISVEDLDKT